MPRRGTHAYLPHTCNPWRDAGPEASKHCAPLPFLLSLPGNYSPGCAFGCYRDPSSASPPRVGEFQQLLLLPLLVRLPSGLGAAGSCCRAPTRSLTLLQLLRRFPPPVTPLPSRSSLTLGAAPRPIRAHPRVAEPQAVPARRAGLNARCPAAFGETDSSARAHPHISLSLHPGNSPATSPPPARLSHPTLAT